MDKWTVIDMDSASEPGDKFTVVGRFESEQEASEWIGRQDPAKVERGGFGIDAPRWWR